MIFGFLAESEKSAENASSRECYSSRERKRKQPREGMGWLIFLALMGGMTESVIYPFSRGKDHLQRWIACRDEVAWLILQRFGADDFYCHDNNQPCSTESAMHSELTLLLF